MEGQDSGLCRAKVGLLSLRDCNRMAPVNCSQCSRAVCDKHQVRVTDGFLCPECAAQSPDLSQKNRAARRAHRRNRYYGGYGYSPYYYGHSHYFSDHDYRCFHHEEGGGGGADTADTDSAAAAAYASGAAGDADAEGDYDIDDSMES